MPRTTLLPRLGAIVGTKHLLVDGDLSAWEQDWRCRARGKALAVLRPANTEQVAAVVKACAEFAAQQPQARLSIVPQGGNTSLALGATPDASGQQLVLSLQRLNALRSIDSANLTLIAEAGCVLQQLQQQAQTSGFLFPLRLASEGSCTLGGNLGSNAGGTQVLRFGNARELCLGLEAVTAQGQIWHGLSGLRKDNSGYDLRHLLIGSEGTLAIITAAVMKLYPLPSSQLTAWLALPSVSAAISLLALAQKHLGADLTGFEIMGQAALDLVARHCPPLSAPLPASSPWHVLLESSSSNGWEPARCQLEQLLQAALATGCSTDALLAHNLTQVKTMWQLRESISMAQAAEGLNIKHDISLPISAMADFVASTEALLKRAVAGARLVVFGHLGDGNLHYNVQAPPGMDAAAFLQQYEQPINQLVFDAVTRFGGSISAEHGIGSLKVQQLAHYKSPVALAMMRSIKQALDPQNLLNPGRVLAR